jgi:hypothetical protein
MVEARIECRSNLRQIYFACRAYSDDFGEFPPAVTLGPDGTPLHSWRALLLPYLEDGDLRAKLYDLGEGWDGPSNITLLEKGPIGEFVCPSYAGLSAPVASYVMADRPITVAGKRVLIWEVHPPVNPWTFPDGDASGQPTLPASNLRKFSSLHGMEYHVPSLLRRSGSHVLYADGTVEFIGSQETSD